MHPHAWATFAAELPNAADPRESRCQAVGEILAAGLRDGGVVVLEADLWRDSGWEVRCQIDGKPAYCFVSYYGVPPVEYVLCCTSDRGLLDWLRRVDHVPRRWVLARAVDRVLASDDRFCNIRWYIARGWSPGEHSPWVARLETPSG